MKAMWLELTDSLGNRTVVNLDLVVSLKEGTDGNTIMETAAPLGGAVHVMVVRESLDDIMRLMEGYGGVRRNAEGVARPAPGLERQVDFVSDGNEG